ncbi:MAG: glycosyltransferase family 4 protein [Christensenellales bacterium]|jgi:glycosyltransferase involved in cell wall biosynthesis
MKVCHMTSAHNNNDVRIFHKECVSLAEAGYEVYLVASGDDSTKKGVNIVGIGEMPESRLKRMILNSKSVYNKALEINADIYHFHDPELLPYGLKLKKLGKKVIFDSHEDYSAQILEKKYIPKLFRRIIAALYKTYESYVVKRLDAVIIPCTFNGKNIFENIAKKTVYIDNLPITTDLDYNNQEKELIRTICYAGGLTYARGITHLIKAAHEADVRLILAGNFSPPEYGDEIQKTTEFKNVDYKGYLDRDGIRAVYKEAAIGMCTILNIGQYNTGDNFATKVYEYMSMGLPVIISKSAYAEKALKEYEFGICVEPDDIRAIANAINYLLENTEIIKKMGREGRRAVLEKFNWEVEEKKLILLYEELSDISS